MPASKIRFNGHLEYTLQICLKHFAVWTIVPLNIRKKIGIQKISRTFLSPKRSSEQVYCSILKATESFSLKASKLLSIKNREKCETLEYSEKEFSPKMVLWTRTIQF